MSSELPESYWAPIQADYEAGLPIKQLCDKHSISEASVRGRAARRDWARPRKHDVEAIGRDFRSGVMTLEEIAAKHGVGGGAQGVFAMAETHNWVRDLGDQIRHETHAKLQADLVGDLDRIEVAVREEAIIEANAAQQATITKAHRSGATKARALVDRMFGELEASMLADQEKETLLSLLESVTDDPAQIEAVGRAIDKLFGIGERAKIAKALVESLTRLVDLERRVYGITEDHGQGDFASALRELAGDV